MTHIPQGYGTWTEEAYAYIRDQLRGHATVGIGQTPYGMKRVEIGHLVAEDAEREPDAFPCAWIAPNEGPIKPYDMGSAIILTHAIDIDVSVFNLSQSRTSPEFADAEQAHRVTAGAVYDALAGLNEPGRAAGHWRELTPTLTRPVNLPFLSGTTLLIATTRLRLERDRKWIT